MASGEPPQAAQGNGGGSPASPQEGEDSTERPLAPGEIGDVSFPVSVRGYDRGAVDAYLSRVQHLVAELEVTRSPEAAVKQALEQVGEQTKGILEHAGETAEQITVAARRDAEATVTRARTKAAEHLHSTRAEAAAVREEAEARRRELQADTEMIRGERSRLLDDLRELATRVAEIAGAADARFPPPQAAEGADEENLQAETAGEEAATEVTAADTESAEAGNQRRPSA